MSRFFVGNDIVDLRDPRCAGKAGDDRFVRRVLHPAEAETVAAAAHPDVALWMCWAAKEAAFKVVSKERGAAPPFEHAKFQVQAAGGLEPSEGMPVRGVVDYDHVRIPFQAQADDSRIHALAWTADSPEDPPSVRIESGEARVRGPRAPVGEAGTPAYELLLRDRFSDRERRSIHSPPSAYARLFASSALARALGIDDFRLEIVCGDRPSGRVPPVVYLDGDPADWDVSLSHHGQLVAWAWAESPVV